MRHPVSVPENPRQKALQFLRSHGRKDNFWDHSALEILENESIELDAEQVLSLRQAVNGTKQKRCTIIAKLLTKKRGDEDEDLLISPSARSPLEKAQADLQRINEHRITRLEKLLRVMSYYCELPKGLFVRTLSAQDIVAAELVSAAKQKDSSCGDIAGNLSKFVCYSDDAQQYSLEEELEFLRLLGLLVLNLKHKQDSTLDLWDRGALLVLSKPDFQLKINLNSNQMNDLIGIEQGYYNFNSPVRNTLIKKELTQICGWSESFFNNRNQILRESEELLAEMQKEQPELANSAYEEAPEKNAMTGLAVGVVAGAGLAAVVFLAAPMCSALIAMTPGIWPVILHVGLIAIASITLSAALAVGISTLISRCGLSAHLPDICCFDQDRAVQLDSID